MMIVYLVGTFKHMVQFYQLYIMLAIAAFLNYSVNFGEKNYLIMSYFDLFSMSLNLYYPKTSLGWQQNYLSLLIMENAWT